MYSQETNQTDKILIVDDIPENLELLGNILNDQGAEISFATNGQEALRIVEYNHPDLILLDISMPHMSGYEVFEELKTKPNTEEIPVIFLTAKNQIEDIVKGFNLGAVDYVTKPFNVTELVARIYNHLKLYKSKRIIERQRKELAETNRVKDKVFSIVSHDLKNPFYNLIGFAELLMKDFRQYDESKVENFLRMMFQTAKQGYNLLENLMEWSRLQSGKIQVYKRNIMLQPLVVNQVKSLAYLKDDKKVEIDVRIPEGLSVSADVNILKSVLTNLLSNAVKYSHRGQPVVVRSEEDASEVRVIIEDKGVGIEPKKLRQLLQGDPQHSTIGTNNEKGTGLGLMICKHLLDAHDSKINAESEPEKGSRFIFSIKKDEMDLFS